MFYILLPLNYVAVNFVLIKLVSTIELSSVLAKVTKLRFCEYLRMWLRFRCHISCIEPRVLGHTLMLPTTFHADDLNQFFKLKFVPSFS